MWQRLRCLQGSRYRANGAKNVIQLASPLRRITVNFTATDGPRPCWSRNSQKRGVVRENALNASQGHEDAARRALQALNRNVLPTPRIPEASRNKRRALHSRQYHNIAGLGHANRPTKWIGGPYQFYNYSATLGLLLNGWCSCLKYPNLFIQLSILCHILVLFITNLITTA